MLQLSLATEILDDLSEPRRGSEHYLLVYARNMMRNLCLLDRTADRRPSGRIRPTVRDAPRYVYLLLNAENQNADC